MRTTLIIDETLLSKAKTLSGLREKTAVVHAGLYALIARESARRLAALGGSQPTLRLAPRRRGAATPQLLLLVDTSVWADHLRKRSEQFVRLLETEQISTHPFVIGELACGNLARRTEIIERLSDLPMLPLADHGEVLYLLHENRLYGTGLGWVDLHLLAAARIAQVPFWTTDKRLAAAAKELAIRSPIN